MKIAFISYQVQEKYTLGTTQDEDALLLDFLVRKGLDAERVVWNDPAVDWKKYELSVLKSPWDYHEKIADFYAWLDRMEKAGMWFLNPIATVRWNSDKHYLKDIAGAGLKVIPSLYLEKGQRVHPGELFEKLNTEKLIIKPCISAGAKNTLVLTRDNEHVLCEQIDALLQGESFMVQPFMPEIHEGEWSFLFFNGKYSHSLLKTPRAGDFRVQHYHGGSILAKESEVTYIRAAEAYVDQFAKGCLYARVDGVISGNELHLMELELIEPYLFLNTHSPACENYYSALCDMMERKK